MKLVYPAIFTPFSDGSGGYTVEVPDLPGCVTEGSDMADAIYMGIDAASGWILGELEDGNTYPSPSSRQSIHVEDESFIQMLVLDIDEYAEKYGSKSVRKNITIPAWLNTYGEAHNINFSEVLQEALLSQAKG